MGDLIAFAGRTMPRYRAAAHHRAIADALMAVERGEIDRLIIIMPPRHGKTELASVRFPAWYLGRHPERRIIGASYAAKLAYRLSRQARNTLASPANPFEAHLAPGAATVAAWDTTSGGGYIAAGIDGGITGMGAHLLVIDDPIKNALDAASSLKRDAAWEWYRSVAYTRLEDHAAIVVIATRWHEDDLIGRLLANQAEDGDRWAVLRLPALAERDDPLGREPGAALWPDKYDREALLRIERVIGPQAFGALYQGDPVAEGTTILPRQWWRRYNSLPALATVVTSWDCSFAAEDDASFVVGQVWGLIGANAYMIDQVRERADFPRTIQLMRTVRAAYPRAMIHLIENKANGPAAIATLKGEIPGILAVNPRGGKAARAIAISGFVKAGNVWLPASAPWAGGFIEEAARFPRGQHDDQVDAASQALLHLYAPERSALPLPMPAVTIYG